MTKQDPIDPANTDSKLEIIHNTMEQVGEKIKGVQTKDDAKETYASRPFMHMIVGRQIPKLSQLLFTAVERR